MSDTDRRDRWCWRWLGRAGVVCAVLFVTVSYSHFDAGGRQQRVSERWHEFWAWAFWSADGSSVIAAGYLCLTVSFFLCLLMQDRPPEAEQDIPLLVLSSSGLTATVIFLLALVPICVP